jgi:hypothetical protein
MKVLVAAALVALMGVTGCGSPGPAHHGHVVRPPAAAKATTPPPPAPVSSSPTATGTCTIGYEAASEGTGGGVAAYFFNPGPMPLENNQGTENPDIYAYQVTITNNSNLTDPVTGFSVILNDSDGNEIGSDQQEWDMPQYISPGQSLTWTEYSEAGSSGSIAAAVGNEDDNLPASGVASCQFLQWMDP